MRGREDRIRVISGELASDSSAVGTICLKKIKRQRERKREREKDRHRQCEGTAHTPSSGEPRPRSAPRRHPDPSRRSHSGALPPPVPSALGRSVTRGGTAQRPPRPRVTSAPAPRRRRPAAIIGPDRAATPPSAAPPPDWLRGGGQGEARVMSMRTRMRTTHPAARAATVGAVLVVASVCLLACLLACVPPLAALHFARTLLV